MSEYFEGKMVEELFTSQVLKSNYIMASKKQDSEEKWDVLTKIRFDVKSIKRISRHKPKDENFHWVELKNVNGEEGWLYGGRANFIVFETEDYWVVVLKTKLQEFIYGRIDRTFVDKPEDALYKLYSRKDRNDMMTLAKTIDLMKIATVIIEK